MTRCSQPQFLFRGFVKLADGDGGHAGHASTLVRKLASRAEQVVFGISVSDEFAKEHSPGPGDKKQILLSAPMTCRIRSDSS